MKTMKLKLIWFLLPAILLITTFVWLDLLREDVSSLEDYQHATEPTVAIEDHTEPELTKESVAGELPTNNLNVQRLITPGETTKDLDRQSIEVGPSGAPLDPNRPFTEPKTPQDAILMARMEIVGSIEARAEQAKRDFQDALVRARDIETLNKFRGLWPATFATSEELEVLQVLNHGNVTDRQTAWVLGQWIKERKTWARRQIDEGNPQNPGWLMDHIAWLDRTAETLHIPSEPDFENLDWLNDYEAHYASLWPEKQSQRIVTLNPPSLDSMIQDSISSLDADR